jgi:DNA repair ATPase RecN
MNLNKILFRESYMEENKLAKQEQGNHISELSNDLNVITAEINSYKQIVGHAIFEIGRRLIHVKKNDLVHGEFGKWLKKIDIHPRVAQQMMKVVKVLDENAKMSSYLNLGLEVLYLIATMPEEEREKEHKIPSTGETKTVDEMTVKELREVKKKLKDLEAEKERTEKEKEKIQQSYNSLEKQYEKVKNMPPKIIEKEKVVEKVIKDDSEIERLKQLMEKQKGEHDLLEKQYQLVKLEMESEKRDADKHRKLKKELESLSDQKDKVIQQLNYARILGELSVKIQKTLEEDLAPIKYSEPVNGLDESDAIRRSLKKTVNRVELWVNEMYEVLGENKFIRAEVIEYVNDNK